MARNRFVRALEAQVPRKIARDVFNLVRYGRGAPLSDQTLFVVPGAVEALDPTVDRSRFRRVHSGCVRGGAWDLARGDIEADIKLRSCRMRWQDGADWPETPQYRKMLQEIAIGRRPDGCATPEDLAARYAALDLLFDEVRTWGRLALRRDLPGALRREFGGVLLHVARDGTCLRSGGGAHRFAIARILDLKEMPAQVGVVHPGALRAGHLAALRQSRDRLVPQD